MKMTIPKDKLLAAIGLTERLVGKKESLPVLSCILLETSAGICMLRSTNLEAGIEVRVPCDTQAGMRYALPAQVFSQVVRSIQGDLVTIVGDESSVRIESKGTKTLVRTVPDEEFPPVSGAREGGVRVSREAVLRGVQSVSYAASPSLIRPELGSVLISLRPEALVCVATDSFRLAEKTLPGVGVEEQIDMLIPLKHATELAHLLERIPDAEVSLVYDDSQLTVIAEGVRFVSRVVDGNFPNYRDIIPKSATTTATLLKADVADMLKKARVFSGAELQVGLHLYPSRKVFTATAQSATVGEMDDELEAALSGEELDINFHIGYLSECLAAIPSDSVTLSFSGLGRPLIIRGVGDASFLYLVMPLNR